jgi:protocatechuate 4,5-dioxygenase beta chain
MAKIIGGFATAHVPMIGKAIANPALQKEPYWRPFFEGYGPVHRWLAEARPDVAVVIYNDHGLNFFLDKMPTFAIGAAPEYHNADEGWGLPLFKSFKGDPDLSWHVIEKVVADEFDLTTCQEMVVDHAFAIPMSLLWPGGGDWPVRTLPVAINTVQHPVPSAARCFKLGQAIGRALRSYPKDIKILVVGTGGLSHQLDGQRAGFINKQFDLMCLDKIVSDPEALTQYSTRELIELGGSQGLELLNWLAMRGVLGEQTVTPIHSSLHIPISNTAAGLILLESKAA